MKKITILFAAALIAGSAMASEKRGISENQFTYACQMKALTPRCKWYYNWGQTPTKGFEDQVADFTELEFVPMAWNGFNEATIRDYVKSHPQCKYILGYNEPNFKAQSNKTPQQAASEWPALQALVVALGAGLAVWGVVNLMEGYGNDNPGAKSQGIKQLMAGGGVVLIGTTLIPLLSGLF